MNGKKVMVAMSGGVDSSVAAKILIGEGYDCTGATMKLFCARDFRPENSRTCCSADDVEDAKSVCFRLGISHYVFNFTSEFEKEVISRFIEEYLAGSTPNPCVDCNRYIKFGKLLRRAEELGFDYIATGHYAEIEHSGDRYLLKRAADPNKDQSYVLWSLTQEELAHLLLPLGKMTKSEVREVAHENGFINADKSESQDICFVPDGDYAAFITRRTGKVPAEGDFLDESGKVLGRHRGILHYTVGQRKGLLGNLGGKAYVKEIRPEDNTVVLSSDASLYSSKLFCREANFISVDELTAPVRVKVAVRYRGKEVWATVSPHEGGVIVELDEPLRAVTPGQSAVFYDGDYVFGGGIISKNLNSRKN